MVKTRSQCALRSTVDIVYGFRKMSTGPDQAHRITKLTLVALRCNVRAQKTVRCMIALATFSLLAACPHPANGLSAAQSPPQNATRPVSGEVAADTVIRLPKRAGPWALSDGGRPNWRPVGARPDPRPATLQSP